MAAICALPPYMVLVFNRNAAFGPHSDRLPRSFRASVTDKTGGYLCGGESVLPKPVEIGRQEGLRQ
jgi:hypothetical protein